MGNEISTRQWENILGVLSRQQQSIDLAYLRHWAQNLDVANQLERALKEAGYKQ